ncbi:hypothetical protein HMPREF2909_07980 [Alloscardovia sp. HMSC034E08]|nr:hypothetical protein HMPREF2909_07980 [Alloscardovia sp. HMSC034E08]
MLYQSKIEEGLVEFCVLYLSPLSIALLVKAARLIKSQLVKALPFTAKLRYERYGRKRRAWRCKHPLTTSTLWLEISF